MRRARKSGVVRNRQFGGIQICTLFDLESKTRRVSRTTITLANTGRPISDRYQAMYGGIPAENWLFLRLTNHSSLVRFFVPRIKAYFPGSLQTPIDTAMVYDKYYEIAGGGAMVEGTGTENEVICDIGLTN